MVSILCFAVLSPFFFPTTRVFAILIWFELVRFDLIFSDFGLCLATGVWVRLISHGQGRVVYTRTTKDMRTHRRCYIPLSACFCITCKIHLRYEPAPVKVLFVTFSYVLMMLRWSLAIDYWRFIGFRI